MSGLDIEARVLIGGPRDGATKSWPIGFDLETPHECPWDGSRTDTARYDAEGRYLHSTCLVWDGDRAVVEQYHWDEDLP